MVYFWRGRGAVMKGALKQDGPCRWRLPRQGDMKVDALVFMNETMMRDSLDDGSLQQLYDAASLEGAADPVVAMPDVHRGFGLPVGGVLASRVPVRRGAAAGLERGFISAGAVGYDINCGVRMMATAVPRQEASRKTLERLVKVIEARVPTGVGKASVRHEFRSGEPLEEIAGRGVAALAERGYARPRDMMFTEEGGRAAGARLEAVSRKGRQRAGQLGTLGGGNHFIEIAVIDEIYEPEPARAFGLVKDRLAVMIHSGSRGFGHQIASDYMQAMVRNAAEHGISLPDRGLAAAPLEGRLAQDYLAAMACAVNYAFCNRQMMMHDVRQAFAAVFADRDENLGLDLVYDVAHNIAKFETHGGRRLLVHRKGATRALPPHHPDNPSAYRTTGHPALVPGTMGTASYVAVGTPAAAASYYSINHGAGRALSRTAARKQIDAAAFAGQLGQVVLSARNLRTLADEAPGAYKDIDAVMGSAVGAGLARRVVRMRPLAVIKELGS
ncbi:MAG: RtcB family protein [Thermaerobacterales bacterium]